MISIEEFDALEDGPEGAHEFTGEYKRKKEKILKEYKICRSGKVHRRDAILLRLSGNGPGRPECGDLHGNLSETG